MEPWGLEGAGRYVVDGLHGVLDLHELAVGGEDGDGGVVSGHGVARCGISDKL